MWMEKHQNVDNKILKRQNLTLIHLIYNVYAGT